MRAVVVEQPGEPDAMRWTEVPEPEVGPGDVLVEVAATAVNRADLLQRQGHYPPPPGAPPYLGLECSGTVAAVGREVDRWRVGDEVCALLAGGGYAERVAVPAGQLMPLPEGIGVLRAAALPEVAATVWSNVGMLAALQPDEVLLVHGGSGGVGTMAVQVGVALGARVATTAGSRDRLERCRALGADVLVDYHTEDFVEVVKASTDGRGADVVLDNMAAAYLGRNVDVLAPDGRLVVIGMQSGTRAELDLGALLRKRGTLLASSLRGRPVEQKAAICEAVVEQVWPWIATGEVQPVVDRVLPFADVVAAHALLESGGVVGKVVLAH